MRARGVRQYGRLYGRASLNRRTFIAVVAGSGIAVLGAAAATTRLGSTTGGGIGGPDTADDSVTRTVVALLGDVAPAARVGSAVDRSERPSSSGTSAPGARPWWQANDPEDMRARLRDSARHAGAGGDFVGAHGWLLPRPVAELCAYVARHVPS